MSTDKMGVPMTPLMTSLEMGVPMTPEMGVPMTSPIRTSILAFNQAFGRVLKTALTSIRELRNARARGVASAWKSEIEVVKVTGKGTREWTDAELEFLKAGQKVPGYDGHHINSVANNSIEMAENPANVTFLTRTEHFAEHSFSWSNFTSGPLMERTLKLGITVFSVLDILDPVAHAEAYMEAEKYAGIKDPQI